MKLKNENCTKLSKSNKFTILALILIIVGYTIFLTSLSILRFLNFYTLNWDLGIAMQTLWTTTHGYLLYETGDYTFFGVHSYLQIHSTYLAYPFAQVYKLSPSANFFFILQSSAIACAILPIYYISKDIVKKEAYIFAIIILFLFNFLIISGLLYDFHWESLIPLEFFTMFYFVKKERYVLSLIPFLIGDSTIEVFPFLSMGIVLYFAYLKYGIKFLFPPKMYKERVWIILFSLLLLSILSYIVLRTLQYNILPTILGYSPNSVAVGSSVKGLFIINIHPDGFLHALNYWFFVYFSLAFIPLLYPKHFIMGLPWFFFTLFINSSYASAFGFQYSFIAVPPLIIGSIYGFSVIERNLDLSNKRILLYLLGIFSVTALAYIIFFSRKLISMNYGFSFGNSAIFVVIAVLLAVLFLAIFAKAAGRNSMKSARRSNDLTIKTLTKRIVIIVIIAIIASNLILSPINTNNFGIGASPGYLLSYGVNPEYRYVDQFIAPISNNATILSSDNLFPFVANNANAYSLAWFSPNQYKKTVPYFPFNSSNLPKYVFVDSSQFTLVPSFLLKVLFNESYYGLVDFLFEASSYPGSIYLFEKGYHGNTAFLNPSDALTHFVFTAKNLSIGPSGFSTTVSGEKTIESASGSHSTNISNVWYGPYYTFLPGEYRLVLNISLNNLLKANNIKNGSMLIDWIAFNQITVFSSNISFQSSLVKKTFNESFTVNLTNPYPNQEIRGFLFYTNGTPDCSFTLNYIKLNKV